MGRDERRNLLGMPGGVPIIGGGNRALLQPPTVLDALQRPLHEGDRVVLLPNTLSAFHSFGVARIEEMDQPGPDGKYGWMKVTLTTEVNFAAVRGQPNAEFCRVLQAKARVESPNGDQPPPLTDEDLPPADAPDEGSDR